MIGCILCGGSISLLCFVTFCLLYFLGYVSTQKYNDSLKTTICTVTDNTVTSKCSGYSKYTGKCTSTAPYWVTTVQFSLQEHSHTQTDATYGWSTLDDVHRWFAQNNPVGKSSDCFYDKTLGRVLYQKPDVLGFYVSAYVFLSLMLLSACLTIILIVREKKWESIKDFYKYPFVFLKARAAPKSITTIV